MISPAYDDGRVLTFIITSRRLVVDNLKQGIENVEQKVKDATTNAGQGAKVDREKAGEHVRDTTAKTEQDIKKVEGG
jgi:hypothetical protein